MNRAKQLRLDRRLGVVEVLNGARISSRTLRKIESGADVVSASLTRLADFYEVEPSELLQPAQYPTTTGEAA